jgi:DNA-binding NtrC family response regulator
MAEWITTCDEKPEWLGRKQSVHPPESTCLVIVWSAAEPSRVGELAFVETAGSKLILGRGGSAPDDRAERVRFFRQRPGSLLPTAPLTGAGISRRQCELRSAGSGISFSNVGRCATFLNGQETRQGHLQVGDLLTLKDQLILLCARRTSALTGRYFPASRAGEFGGPDAYGIVGESQAIWELREQLAFLATLDKHILILGESGSGKELAARAIHLMSSRSQRPLVARNAATFPSTLIDAELFGNAPNYPNAGMPARPGVIGEAHQSTLLLDEIGELPRDLQAHLLRVLDNSGEYQRLGDAQTRRSDFRLIAATNRDPTELRLDILGRLTLQAQLPGLQDRLEDIPLLVRHLMREAARSNADLRRRFFADAGAGLQPRLDPDLVEMLLRHSYTYNVRELEALLWKAVAGSAGEYIALTGDLQPEPLSGIDSTATSRPTQQNPSEMTREDIVDCLNRNAHNVAIAANELGLRSRYALYRLMRRHGITVERVP